jgi:PPOX class probable F420-dependent enzyme
MSASTNSEIERLGAATYLSLTTFRKDGTPVATPVWASRDGEHLYVWTETDAGKIKRLRNSGRVLLAPCDSRGGLQGAQVEGTAVVLDSASDVERLKKLHRSKYGLQFRLFDGFASLFRRSRGHVVVEISVPVGGPAEGTAS